MRLRVLVVGSSSVWRVMGVLGAWGVWRVGGSEEGVGVFGWSWVLGGWKIWGIGGSGAPGGLGGSNLPLFKLNFCF